MPSLLFHTAIGALIGLAMLGDDLDRWTLAAFVLAAAIPDIDTLLALWFPGAHRTYLHNVFVFVVPAFVLLVFSRFRPASLQQYWSREWAHVGWVCILIVAVAGIGLDLTGSGVNLFYPVHDQYYHFGGSVTYSSHHGLQQTVFDPHRSRIGSTKDMYYATGFDPAPGPAPANVERRFPLFGNSIQLLLSVTAFGIVLYRMQRRRRQPIRFFSRRYGRFITTKQQN